MYQVISEKEILKQNKELVELHKRCLKTYLVQQSCKARVRNKFFKLYDMYIDEKNIREYFYTPTPLLITYLVLDRLNEVSTYIFKIKKHGKRRKSTKH